MDLLRQLENLGALSERNGLIEIKPFKSWKGNPYWAEAIFKVRLCNAGEVLDISSYADQFSQDAKERVIKIDTVVRSLYEINNVTIGSTEEISKYNQRHNVNLTRLEYLRNWAKDLEQLVVDVLYTNYIGLQLKQVRLVTDQVMCDVCGQTYEKELLPPGSKETIYSIGEIVCGNCITSINEEDFDFKELTPLQKETPEEIPLSIEEPLKNIGKEEAPYICACNKEFYTLEEFVEHRTGCPEANQ